VVEHKLHVIPEPEKDTRVVFRQTTTKQPYFHRGSSEFFVCGKCRFALVLGFSFQELDQEIRKRFRTGDQGIVVQCPDCKAFNELGTDVG
jgi:hypothetical protein